MSRIFALLVAVLVGAVNVRADDDAVFLVVKSGSIARTKSSGMPWDFPLAGRKALPDPYVKAWVYDKDGAHVDYGETAVEWDTLTPVWDKELIKVRAGQRVTVEVWDKDLKYDDIIGKWSFTLTDRMIDKGSFERDFGRVESLRFDVRVEARAEPRVVLQQPFPGPHSAKHLERSKGQDRAVILVHGLDLRDDGGDPANPRFVDWQGSTSLMVKSMSKHADVFAISYAQTTAVEEIAAFPELRETVAKVKKLGYREIVMVGHSAGGILSRHFVEEHPRAGITLVVQIAAPNGGAKLASWAVNLLQVPKAQAPFVQSLSPAHREAVARNRTDKRIPSSIDFVSVIACDAPNSKGDGAISRECQWPADLQGQGIPAVYLQGAHLDVLYNDECLSAYCRLIREPQPRVNSQVRR